MKRLTRLAHVLAAIALACPLPAFGDAALRSPSRIEVRGAEPPLAVVVATPSARAQSAAAVRSFASHVAIVSHPRDARAFDLLGTAATRACASVSNALRESSAGRSPPARLL